MFFFSSRRRHTRCLSDWSSDVCSSDLMVPSAEAKAAAEEDAWKTSGVKRVVNQLQVVPPSKQEARSEERRVGKEWRSRWTSSQRKENGRGVGGAEVRGSVELYGRVVRW